MIIAFKYVYSVPSLTVNYVGILGGREYNDGIKHIGVIDIIKGTNYALLNLSYDISTNGSNRINVSCNSDNIVLCMILISE